MKNLYSLIFSLLLVPAFSQAQNVGISDSEASFTPDNSAALEIKSTSRGVLVPRLTTAQRNAISTPAEGLLVYDNELDYFFFYASGWQQLGGTSGSGGTSLEDADADTKIMVESSTDNDKVEINTAGVTRMEIDNAGNVKMGGSNNYTNIESDGSLRMHGEATTYTDLVVPITSTTRGGSKDPDFNEFKDNGSGSQGVFGFDFDDDNQEELYFMVQMPHSWVEGTDIYPHVHWTSDDTDVGSKKVRWGLEYTWTNVGEEFPLTSIIYGEDPIAPCNPVTEDLHAITELGTLSGTGKTLSSILVCRVFRDAGHSNDNFGKDATLLMLDFHFQEDAFGSRGVYTK